MKKINISDMNCKHCVMSISSALANKGIEFAISLEDKQVEVSDSDFVKACEAIQGAGFTVCE